MWKLWIPGYVFFARGEVAWGCLVVCLLPFFGCWMFPLGLLLVPVINILASLDDVS